MMQLTPQKIAAIKALADDERGDPNTRKIAQAKLEQYRKDRPELFSDPLDDAGQAAMNAWFAYKRNPPNPRMRKGDDYLKWVFMDLGNWKLSTAGNYVIITGEFRVTLFKRKTKGSFWGWSKSPVGEDSVEFSKKRFGSVGEAQRDAWQNLQT